MLTKKAKSEIAKFFNKDGGARYYTLAGLKPFPTIQAFYRDAFETSTLDELANVTAYYDAEIIEVVFGMEGYEYYKALESGEALDSAQKTYTFHVNLDERGEFYADVRDSEGETVFEIDTMEAHSLVEDGGLKHKLDLAGLEALMKTAGVIPKDAELVMA